MKVLVVVDMQNDFIDGALGTPEAQAIVPKVVKKIEEFDGEVLWTQDTHSDDYLETQEGRLLPVKHCISASNGWQIHSSVKAAIQSKHPVEWFREENVWFISTCWSPISRSCVW